MRKFEAPKIVDYGTLVGLTASTGFTGAEDGGSKLLIHHTSAASTVLGP